MPRPTTPDTPFAGFSSPNYTQVPDELFDALMPSLSDAELRVLLYIIRRTFGFKQDADAISLSQMVSGITTRDGRVLDQGTGLSKATVARGLKGLRDKQVILAERRSSLERGNESTTYQLRFKSDVPSQINPVSQLRDKGATPPLVSPTRQGLSHQRDTQETVKQQTDFNISNHSKGENLAKKTIERQQSISLEWPDSQQSIQPTAKHGPSDPPLKALIARRAPKRVGDGEDRQAIGVIIEDFAHELGDSAPTRSSVTRAVNLFEHSGASRDGFIDLLFQARASTREMRASAKHRPQKPMAYFFSVVEYRLGVKRRAI